MFTPLKINFKFKNNTEIYKVKNPKKLTPNPIT